jgi:hypothetical protein
MAGAYLATNVIDSDATITPSTVDTSYPVTNLYDRIAAKVFRCTSKTTLTLEFDLGSAHPADTIAIINHNMTSGASLSLKAGDSPNPSTGIATPTYRARDIWKAFTDTSKRYWKLEISDGSNPAILQIGQIIIGRRIAFPVARRIGNYSPARKRNMVKGETYAGSIYNYLLFERAQLNPSFRIGAAADLAVFETLDQTVYGDIHPFVYIPSVAGGECYYVRKEQDFEPQEFTSKITGGNLVHD